MAEDQRSESLSEPTDLETDLYSRSRPMLKQAWKRRVSLRFVSLKFTNLYEGFVRTELPLDADTRQHEARRHLSRVIDELRGNHGRSVVMRGHDLLLAGQMRQSYTLSSVPAKRTSPRLITTQYVPLNVHSY